MTEFAELGLFRPLGTVTPNSIDFTPFPTSSNQGNSILIAQYQGDLSKIRSYLYLREIYQSNPKTVSRKWVKLHPKPEIEIINNFFNPEFFNLRLEKQFEVIKWFPFRIPGKIVDPDYSISLYEHVLLPQYANKYRESFLSQGAIDQLTAAIIQGLREQGIG